MGWGAGSAGLLLGCTPLHSTGVCAAAQGMVQDTVTHYPPHTPALAYNASLVGHILSVWL